MKYLIMAKNDFSRAISMFLSILFLFQREKERQRDKEREREKTKISCPVKLHRALPQGRHKLQSWAHILTFLIS